MGWIKSMRIPTSIMAGLLVIVSFRMTQWANYALYLSVFTFLGASATMVLNDWFDRVHDMKKGKTFAHSKGKKFFIFAVFLWVVVLIMAFTLFMHNVPLGLFGIGMFILGITYSFTRVIPLLPAVHVGLACGAVALYPNVFYEIQFGVTWFLAAMTFVVIFGREVLKDIQDHPNDIGYKRTMPQLTGITGAKVAAGITFVIAGILAINVATRAYLVVPLLGIALITLVTETTPKLTKDIVSVSMMFFLILLVF